MSLALNRGETNIRLFVKIDMDSLGRYLNKEVKCTEFFFQLWIPYYLYVLGFDKRRNKKKIVCKDRYGFIGKVSYQGGQMY